MAAESKAPTAWLAEHVGKLRNWAEQNPGAAVLATNAATVSIFMYLKAQEEGGVVPFVKSVLKGALEGAVQAAAGGSVEAEIRSTAAKIEDKVLGDDRSKRSLITLPAEGLSKQQLLADLQMMAARDRATWEAGKVSGAIYHGGDDLTEVMGHAFTLFALSNPLHPELFPSVRNMEAEVVSWTCRLFNGGDKACGTMSSGGTESILLACRAYREYGRTTRGITRPNMVIPATAHAAFHKAGDYFGIAVRIVPVDQTTFKADVSAMGAAMDSNTIMIMGSAIQFAQGVVDPIQELAQLAAKKGGVPLHVDCCLGSFIVPFASEVFAEMGQPPLTPFDFAVPGVTSISCDTHKFGYAPKGSSVIMYSEEKFRLAQFYVSPRWTGGVYATPTISGSRAGALVAATWATMRFIGADGYRAAARTILGSVKEVAAGVQRMHDEGLGIKLYGKPDLCVVAFGPDPDAPRPAKIFAVFDAMSARGWQLNSLQFPASVHLCVTHKNAEEAAARFETDLRAAVAEVDANADAYKDGMGKIYGMAESIPVDGPLELLSKVFLSALYATPKGGEDAEYWWTTKPETHQ